VLPLSEKDKSEGRAFQKARPLFLIIIFKIQFTSAFLVALLCIGAAYALFTALFGLP
jgi:hypothetical protein